MSDKHREALAKYEDAVAVWDHPAIRFNMVRALIALDRPLEAYENLEKALAYGKDPLEDQVYSEAQNYQRLLEGLVDRLADPRLGHDLGLLDLLHVLEVEEARAAQRGRDLGGRPRGVDERARRGQDR